uniref:AMP-binding protein n=1 Tax=Aliarcobacter sp. TaxID=2321116 RepID=UPI004048DD43
MIIKNKINFDIFKNNIFYKDGKNVKTWEDAHNIVKKLTNYFKEQGLKKGDIIAIDTNKDFFTYCSILSCYIYGITFAPLRFSEIKEDLKVCKDINISFFLSSSNNKLDEFILISSLLEKEYSQIVQLEEDLDSIAYILHSSGSTGNPKVIPISYYNLHCYLQSVIEMSTIREKSTFAQTVELTFDLSIHDMFLSFYHGGSLVPLSGSIAKFAPRFINSLDINNLMIVPSFINAMNIGDIPLKSVENVYFCGEALGVKIAKKALEVFPNAKIYNFYGPTEATVAVSYFEVKYHNLGDDNIVPIGKPLSSSTLILSEENELLIGGNQVFNGYIGKTEKNPLTFVNNYKFYKSGDICSYDGENFRFVSRIDFQIKFRGYRIELEGVEAILGNNFKGSFGVIGFNETSPNNFSDLMIFYTDKNLSINDMKNSLPKHLNGATFDCIDIIPRNNSGKINRHELKRLIK